MQVQGRRGPLGPENVSRSLRLGPRAEGAKLTATGRMLYPGAQQPLKLRAPLSLAVDILCALAMWLDDKRGQVTDWTTQLWVKLTGKRIDLELYPWLKGPIGKPDGIGSDFFNQLAREQNLSVEQGRGLLEDFKQLASERCDTEKISPLVNAEHF